MPKNSSDKITSFEHGEDDTREIEEYWTEERIENAEPVELPVLSEEEFEKLRQKSGVQDSSLEEPQTIESYDPETKKSAAEGTPTPADVKKRPYWNGGRFFFTKDDGKDYACSAEFVGSDRVVMTAAHCIVDGSTGKMYKNFLFRRAYNNGGGQKVQIKCGSVWAAWYSGGSSNHAYDYAFLYTKNKSSAGWLGFKRGVPYSSWTAIGYPKNYGGGKKMYKVVGSKGTVSGGIVQMLNNPMRSGCSGGAWIGDVTTPHVGGNYAIGLNSFHYDSDPNSEYGPLFDSKTWDLFSKVKTGTCPNS